MAPIEDQNLKEEEMETFDDEESLVQGGQAPNVSWGGRRKCLLASMLLLVGCVVFASTFLQSNHASVSLEPEQLLSAEVEPEQPLSAEMLQTLDKCRNDTYTKCVMFSMRGSGLGSQLLNMYANRLYLEETYGYSVFMVDEAAYNGYKLHGNRMLTGYFSAPFFRVENEVQRDALDPYFPERFSASTYDKLGFHDRLNSFYRDMVVSDPPAGALVMVGRGMFHHDVHNWMNHLPNRGYDRMVDAVCSDLQFNEDAVHTLRWKRRKMYDDLPDLRQQPYNSVAFHVRRTDKLIRESKLYPATEYVHILNAVLQQNSVAKESVKICFLATDDFSVTTEMQEALTAQGYSCRLVFSPQEAGDSVTSAGDPSIRYRGMASLVFMTELSVMLEATYFVGTFNSNVGALASVLRGCPDRYNASAHYANSYGVDESYWYFR